MRTCCDLARAKGFTVLEVLAVLVIGAILLALLQQGFSLSLRASARANEVANTEARRLLGEAWFRQVLTGVLAARVGEAGSFTGDESRISALGAVPLLPASSQDLRFSLQLRPTQDGATLFYQQAEREVRVLDLAAGARFAYLDEKRTRFAQWPSRSAGNSGDSAAPAWVEIVGRGDVPALVVSIPQIAPRLRDVSPFGTPARP
jgi:prepilin-type N-terminal cleavage/methylation domain-containing protein